MTSVMPYGPNSGAVRQFLVRLAGLGAADRTAVVERYVTASRSRDWQQAERQLAETLARSDREGYRESLSGPLLQLVRRKDAPEPMTEPTTDEEALAMLEPIAEPALAALLTLLVRDLLADGSRETLLAPFAGLLDSTGS